MEPTTTKSLSILWIHGFAGRANNDIVQCMPKHYPEYVFHSIEVDHNAISSMEKINTYKPGREDGQTTFIFTEQLLQLFGELKIGSLSKNICHYTAHDQVLGEV